MRIIGGALGGRRLRAPHGLATRPTSDRVREAIFNILGPTFFTTPRRVLDLFAGAGGLALEALSRGATGAVLVDSATDAVRCMQENVDDLDLGEVARVVRADVYQALPRLVGDEFGLVFADPPYATDDATRLLTALGETHAALLLPDARVVIEHDRRSPTVDKAGVLSLLDRRRYGDTEVSFYRSASP
jgi:16S rRNA (guanine966-N2)-methyltransferase